MATDNTDTTVVTADAKAPATTTVLRQEIATIARDPFHHYWGGIVRPRDETLASRGGPRGIWIYEDLKRDPRIWSGIDRRLTGLLSKPQVVEPASDSSVDTAAADAFRSDMARWRWNKLCRGLLDGELKGFAVAEVMWSPVNGRLQPWFRMRDQRRFVFDEDGNLRLLVREDMLRGIELPPRKFIVFRYAASDENPYGLGMGTRLFWPALFKRQATAFWLQRADRITVPTTIGKYPSGTQPEQQQVLLAAVNAIRSGAGATVPIEMAVEFLDPKGNANITTAEDLVRFCNEEIDSILGLETQGPHRGGAAAAAAIERQTLRSDISKSMDEALSEVLEDTLVQWYCELNFPGAVPPRLYRDTDEAEDLNARADRDKTLFGMGYRLSADQVQETYGGDYVDIRAEQLAQQAQQERAALAASPASAGVAAGAKVLPPTQASAEQSAAASAEAGAEFAAADEPTFPDQAAIDAALNAVSANDQQALMAPVIQPLLDIVAKAKDPTALLGQLVDAYPSMDTSKLEALLARLFFVAMIHGQVSVGSEAAGDA